MTGTLGIQTAQFETLAQLAKQHPLLPAVYATCGDIIPGEVSVMTETAAAFEAWREALGAPIDDVTLSENSTTGKGRLRFSRSYNGLTLCVSASLPTVGMEVTA